MKDKVALKPPYASYRSFVNLLGEFREQPVLPAAVDRSYLRKKSGSEQSALIAALKWFGLIDEENAPTQDLRALVKADESTEKDLLKRLMEQSYALLSDGSINLQNATTSQMVERFRQYEISGSTLTKSIAFFLGAAKDAGISISPHVRAPMGTSVGTAKKRIKASVQAPPSPVSEMPAGAMPAFNRASGSLDPNRIYIPIPIFNMQDGLIELPAKMDERQWNSVIKMIDVILKNYRDTMASTDREGKGE